MCEKKCRACCPPPCCGSCAPPCCGSCPPPCKYSPVSFCIFDLDSAILELRNVYPRACQDVVANYGKTVPDIVLLQASPMETQEMAELVARKCKLEVPWEQLLDEVNARAFELISNPPFMAGAERLVRHLESCCVSLGLVCSCTKKLFAQKIRGRESFFELFEFVVCSDDPELNQRKPSPDPYLLAMSRFCSEPTADCVLAFDGTQKGVQAAKDARMQIVMLPDPQMPCYWSELATVRLETLEEFKPEEFGLPSYDCAKKPRRRC